jgi:hypothetical protein
MDEDKLHDQIQKGHQARAISEPLRLAGERVKQALTKHLMECKAEEMSQTRQLILAINMVIKALDDMMADGSQAQHQLEIKTIEQGRHRMYGVG